MTTIYLNNTPLTVDYYVTPYYPASRFEPEEPSELEITAVKVEDFDITALLSKEAMQQIEIKVLDEFFENIDEFPTLEAKRLRNRYRLRYPR